MISFTSSRIPMGRDRRLQVNRWTLKSGECWVICGPGGSGKSSLARAVAGTPGESGTTPVISGLERTGTHETPGAWISFDREKEIRREMRRNDDSEWTGRPDDGTKLEEFVGGKQALGFLTAAMASKLAGRGIRHLSTGEFRQVLIAREAGRKPAAAVLDEPWEGLDVESRPRLTAQIKKWLDSGILIVLTVNRMEDIPPFATGVVRLEGDRAHVSESGDADTGKTIDSTASTGGGEIRIPPPPSPPPEVGEVLLEMKNVAVAFHGRKVLDGLDWKVEAGESWLLTGPNGSGKTTLMNLISGDEPRGYGQDIHLFGLKKGSGESTNWLKSRMGRVSAILQETISNHATAVETVGSGLRNSMVLTDTLDGYEQSLVRDWLEILEMGDRAERPFRSLSYGDRRLAMIGRAMITHPPLLLLDEPMHGLDEVSRNRVSGLVDALIRDTGTTVIFVSHRPEDAPESVKNHIRLIPSENNGPSGVEIGIRQA